jgi:hypothetical protein
MTFFFLSLVYRIPKLFSTQLKNVLESEHPSWIPCLNLFNYLFASLPDSFDGLFHVFMRTYSCLFNFEYLLIT